MNTSIKYIRLVDGTDIVSEVNHDDWQNKNMVELFDPMRLYVFPSFMNPVEPTNDHSSTLYMTEWVPWAPNPVKILLNNIVAITDVDMNMAEHYESSRSGESTPDLPESLEELDELRDVFNEVVKNKKRTLN